MKLKIYQKILIGLVVGSIIGLVAGSFAVQLKPIGDIFIRLLRMLVMPLVAATLITGIAGTADIRRLGRLGMRTVAYFLATTLIAVLLGVSVAMVIQPGSGIDLSTVAQVAAPEPVSLITTLVNLVPLNPFDSFARGDVLPIMIFSLFFGLGIALVGEKARPVKDFFASLAAVMFKVSDLVIGFAPWGVGALIAWVFGTFGLSALLPMAKIILAVFIGCSLHVAIAYLPAVALIAKVKPMTFLRKVVEPAMVAFSTTSSAAAFPFSMKSQKRLGVSPRVSSFVMPLALQINMDGTALYQAVATIFIANAVGLELGLGQLLTLILTAVLASIGTASIPGGGLIMLTMVVTSVGLPLEGIAIIAGIDRILDMMRTSVNVIGDNSAGLIVSALEGDLDREAFNAEEEVIEPAVA